jgi:hypothetical protein
MGSSNGGKFAQPVPGRQQLAQYDRQGCPQLRSVDFTAALNASRRWMQPTRVWRRASMTGYRAEGPAVCAAQAEGLGIEA